MDNNVRLSVLMPDENPTLLDSLQMRERALARWSNEGGALREGPKERRISTEELSPLAEADRDG